MDFRQIGEFIKKLRKERGESQQQLADSINMDRSNLSRIESGKVMISLENLELISTHFDISINQILCSGIKKSSEKESSVKYLYKNNLRISKVNKFLKILILTVIFFLVLFLSYFFIFFYNSVKVFSIECDEYDFMVTSGIIMKTNDRVYLSFTPLFLDENSIKDYSLLYKSNGKNKYIMSSDVIRPIEFTDTYNYQEYINFLDFQEIIENFYFEINYLDGSSKIYKLNVSKNYSSSKIFINYQNKDERILEDELYEENEIIKKVTDKYFNLGKPLYIKYDKKEYEVFIGENFVSVIYMEELNKITLKYIALDGGDFFKYVNGQNKYGKSINSDNCDFDCDDFLVDYNLFMKVISKIIEK